MEKKTIALSSIISVLFALGIVISPSLFSETQYFCETRPEIGLVHCDSFSKYVALNGKCIRNENTNLICREGWTQVIDDTVLPEEEPEKEIDGMMRNTVIHCTREYCYGVE